MTPPRVVDRYVRHPLDPVLYLVGNVRDDLDRLAQVIPPPLPPDDVPVHLPGRDVVIARETNAQESLVIAEVEVGLAPVVEDVGLAVLEGAHGPGVDVQVRIDLYGGDAESTALEHPAHGGDGHALAEA